MAKIRDKLSETIKEVYKAVRKVVIIGYSPSNISRSMVDVIGRLPIDEQKSMCDRFAESKQQELASVLIASALISSLVASLLSWGWFPVPAYTAQVCMLCALLHSLLGLGIATQQSVALSRVYSHPKRSDVIRIWLIESPVSSNKSWTSAWLHFSWQSPTMLLGNSIVFVIVGLSIAVFDAARKSGAWGPEVITALCFAISFAFSVTCYFISWRCIEWTIQEAFMLVDPNQ